MRTIKNNWKVALIVAVGIIAIILLGVFCIQSSQNRAFTLEELLATWKPNHPDVLRLKAKYGEGIQFSTIAHRSGVKPQFELSCYKLKKLKGA